LHILAKIFKPINLAKYQMRNILLIGGMGSGKSTLAVRLLRENPNANYIYMSKFNVRIPMALIATTHP